MAFLLHIWHQPRKWMGIVTWGSMPDGLTLQHLLMGNLSMMLHHWMLRVCHEPISLLWVHMRCIKKRNLSYGNLVHCWAGFNWWSGRRRYNSHIASVVYYH
jgi:hypothetical protein